MTADVRLAVLKVLGGQSPGYFIYPNAAAFHALGLDPAEVADALDELHKEGRLDREVYVTTVEGGVDDGATVEVPGGYRLKPEKGGDMSEETAEPEVPTPQDPEPETEAETEEDETEEEAEEAE